MIRQNVHQKLGTDSASVEIDAQEDELAPKCLLGWLWLTLFSTTWFL
jgi:hypothetical protein